MRLLRVAREPRPSPDLAVAASVPPVPPLASATMPVTLVAFPDKFAVIVPAVKLPEASRMTIVDAVLAFVAAFARPSAV